MATLPPLSESNHTDQPLGVSWDQVTASDIVTLNGEGEITDSDWNVTPAIGLHLQMHALRPDAHVVIHNHAHWSGIGRTCKKYRPCTTGRSYCGSRTPLYNEYGVLLRKDTSLSAAEAIGDARWALLVTRSLVVAKDLRQPTCGYDTGVSQQAGL